MYEDLISHHVEDPCVSYSDCCCVLTYSCLQTARSCLIAQFGTTWHEMEILMCLFSWVNRISKVTIKAKILGNATLMICMNKGDYDF